MSQNLGTEDVKTTDSAPVGEVKEIAVNSIVDGRVIRIKPFGAIVQLPDKSQGLIHISHISTKYVQDINDFISVGDTVSVKVLTIDEESGKISLSMKHTEQRRNDSNTDLRTSYFDSGDTRQDGDNPQAHSSPSFEDKFKDWVKASNERQAGLNKRNKRK